MSPFFLILTLLISSAFCGTYHQFGAYFTEKYPTNKEKVGWNNQIFISLFIHFVTFQGLMLGQMFYMHSPTTGKVVKLVEYDMLKEFYDYEKV